MEIYDNVKSSVINVLKATKQEEGEYFHTNNVWKNICIEEQTNAEGLSAMEHIYPDINTLIMTKINELSAEKYEKIHEEMKEKMCYDEEDYVFDDEIVKYMKEDIAGNDADEYEDVETNNNVAEIQIDRHD